ncbi:MAG: hypothetical protein D6820_00420 [Lentisphaerae bacterium]|nr:MAG: hypothetical protein D6820_00420 [Lentisphaerota bacterium]
MNKRPNILILMTDEHRADVLGYAGNPVIRTPTLDWLAETGVVFNNCYTPSPICIPMRQCMASGQLPRTCGVECYGQDLPPGYLTFARHFSRHAYLTTACGKLHHMGPDTNGGWMRRVGMDHQIVPSSMRKMPGAVEAEFHRYGGPPEKKWSDVKEIKRAGIGKGPHTHVWDEYATVGFEHMVQEYFLDAYYDRTERHLPQMLYLGLNNPHYPYLADEELFNYYLNRVPLFLDEEPFDHPFLGKSPFWDGPVIVGRDITEREMRRAVAAYYANVETCDRLFARALDALKHAGEDLDEWIIIFTSDHGEMLGQHAIWEKQKFFEGSARIPLIIRYPKQFNHRVVDQNVNACDIFATLCELAQLPTPEGLDSRSLVPLMRGETEQWDNETISQFAGRNCMIKRDHLKYQWYGVDMPEVLFDLQVDPGETRNFIDDPAYADAVTAFRNRLAELGFGPTQ